MRPTAYPKIKFADTNNIPEQLIHVKSEMEEFQNAWVMYCYHKFETGNKEKMEQALKAMILEAHDMVQSAVTMVDVLERKHPGQAWSAREEMIKKNDVRGYHGEEVPDEIITP